ncbi:hypothetical protein NFI96_031400 [Prochilodus magdalenae]|nr:hypothetical protein NFI96_031400 [Prochilodus magdalenae]
MPLSPPEAGLKRDELLSAILHSNSCISSPGIAALLLSTVMNGAAGLYYVCQTHSNLSDPWRNIGFRSSPFPEKNDLGLKAGWYSFGGIGGDHMVYFCPYTNSTPTLSSIRWSNSTISTPFQLYTCDAVYWSTGVSCAQQNITTLHCGGGLILYYLVPTQGLYASPIRPVVSMLSAVSLMVAVRVTLDSPYLTASYPQETHTDVQVVLEYLKTIENSLNVLKAASTDQMKLASYGNSVLNSTLKLLSILAMNEPTTKYNQTINMSLPTLEVQLAMIGPNASSTTTELNRSNASMDISLTETLNNNKGSIAIAFVSYSNLLGMLSPSLFKPSIDTNKTMVSAVVSAALLKTSNTKVTTPVSVSLKHTAVVVDMLIQVMDVSMINGSSSDQQSVARANNILGATEKLVSALVTYTDTYKVTPIFLPNLEVQIFMMGPNASLAKIPKLNTSTAYLDIDLIGIAKNNNGSAAVAFMSYTNVTNMLDASFFATAENTTKTMMSTVVTASLIKISNVQLTTPVNFTLKHIAGFNPDGNMSCVYWNNTSWIVNGCYLLQSNSTHSVCSCYHLSTFALIMQTKPPPEDHFLELLTTIAVVVGLVFLSLALLTFVLFRHNPRVNNTARMNLCISLFLAHLLFLLTQSFLQYIRTVQLACAVLAGVLHFLFLSAFVWMFIEAVLLFISVKNITKIRSQHKQLLSWKYMIVIGYIIPLVAVGVSVGLFPEGYGSQQCWIKTDTDFVWSFLGPVCLILTINLILFFAIIITLRSALGGKNGEHSQLKQMRTLIFKTLIQIVILGCPWILGFFTQGSKVLEILFLFLNSQQGTFIFLVHCVLNQEVLTEKKLTALISYTVGHNVATANTISSGPSTNTTPSTTPPRGTVVLLTTFINSSVADFYPDVDVTNLTISGKSTASVSLTWNPELEHSSSYTAMGKAAQWADIILKGRPSEATTLKGFFGLLRARFPRPTAQSDSFTWQVVPLEASAGLHVAEEVSEVLPARKEASAGPPYPVDAAAGPPAAEDVVAGPPASEDIDAGPPAAVDVAAGPSAAVDVAAGPPAAVDVAAGPPAAVDVAAGPPAAVDIAAGPPAAVDIAAGPPAAVDVAAGPPAAVGITGKKSDPCNKYITLDQPWRGTNETGLWICDRYFNWDGWYRLLYNGMNIRMPESCVDKFRCGTYNTLWLNGPHPQIQDGIVTRRVCGKSGIDCCYYSSTPIRVKACPGNYYVYEFVSPAFFDSAYCAADTLSNITFDPCNVYTTLNNDWRAGTRYYYHYNSYDDTLVEWSGWYRLYLQGKSAQIPESDRCWRYMTCGGYTSLLLGGSHPLPQDGVVNRDVYGIDKYRTQCILSLRSNPIQVKACPGNYYVYRLVKPAASLPMPTYCAVAFETLSYDPCNQYTTLDQPWRGTNETGLLVCDSYFNWTGWYRLLYNGMNIRMPESRVSESRCGAYNTLWLNGSHPQIQDGIVTREVCGNSYWQDCCNYSSTTIQVKACPGNYYVYEFVSPAFFDSAYCADSSWINLYLVTISLTADPLNNMTFDPCNVYTTLNDDWRAATSYYYYYYYYYFYSYDDTLADWSGWYRLYLQGKSAQIPESDWCWSYMTCGGYASLLLGGSHPLPQDGVVNRDVYGIDKYRTQCILSLRSNPIQVKACPGNYYVYRLVKPAVSLPMPTYCAVAFETLSYDPCNNYTTLDQPWRGTNETGVHNQDCSIIWAGWYRLLYNGMNIHMPESCVNRSRCGTYTTLWLNGSHPQIQDGIVIRRVCMNVGREDCCYYRSTPIRVKACPGNYYIYEFVRPASCSSAYCADFFKPQSKECQADFTLECVEILLKQIQDNTATVIPTAVIVHTLEQLMSSTKILEDAATDQSKLVDYGKSLLNATETLVSTLVTKTNTSYYRNITLPSVQAAVFVLGTNASLKEIQRLNTSSAYLDINISVENKGIEAVLFLSYTNMSSFLKPDLFKSSDTAEETMMSTIVTVKLLSNSNEATPKQRSKRAADSKTNEFVVTLEHTATVEPKTTLHCVNWREIEWVEGNCRVIPINSTRTTCYCVYPGTFALIMQTSGSSMLPVRVGRNSETVFCFQTPRSLDTLNTVTVAVGLFFLTLALLTFALCQRNPKTINTALINLCISLFLAHLLFLLTQKFLIDISINSLACRVIAGVLHFLFLSAFVWMSIEAVLLLIIVKNLTELRAKKQEILSWKCLIVIGYVIPLFVVGVSVGLFPDGYGSKQCWLKTDENFIWSFLGPVCFILGVDTQSVGLNIVRDIARANVLLFIIIGFLIVSTLRKLNSENLKVTLRSDESNLVKSVMLKTLLQFVVIGCPWFLGFFTKTSEVINVLFLIFNSQQGTFIFFVHCFLNHEVRYNTLSFHLVVYSLI